MRILVNLNLTALAINNHMLRILLICLCSFALVACSYSVVDRYDVNKIWVDNEQISILFSKIKERQTSSLINIHGTVTAISNENGVYNIKIPMNGIENTIDLRDVKVLSNRKILFFSKALEISESEGVYFINGIKTHLSPACSNFTDDDNSLVVFGAKFIHCNKVFNWKSQIEEEPPVVFSNQIEKLPTKNTIVFSATPSTIGIAQIHNNESIVISEFDENLILSNNRIESIHCNNCKLRISVKNSAFFGYSGFALYNDNRDSLQGFKNADGNANVDINVLYCTVSSCKMKEKYGLLNMWGFQAISGDLPKFFSFKPSNYKSAITTFTSQKFNTTP
jgi:hypothetical protein